MELKVEYGISADGTHIAQRVTLGAMQTVAVFPLAMTSQLKRAITEAEALARRQIIVPGAQGIIWPNESRPLAPKQRDEDESGESQSDGNERSGRSPN